MLADYRQMNVLLHVAHVYCLVCATVDVNLGIDCWVKLPMG